MNKSVDYETDFYAWALHNAELLRQGRFSEVDIKVDIKHVAEELEDMGSHKPDTLSSNYI